MLGTRHFFLCLPLSLPYILGPLPHPPATVFVQKKKKKKDICRAWAGIKLKKREGLRKLVGFPV